MCNSAWEIEVGEAKGACTIPAILDAGFQRGVFGRIGHLRGAWKGRISPLYVERERERAMCTMFTGQVLLQQKSHLRLTLKNSLSKGCFVRIFKVAPYRRKLPNCVQATVYKSAKF